MGQEKIFLGDGVFSVGGVDIALSRGGGQFTVEREYRQIQADGDRGPVKGRIRLINSVAKLTMNVLEILPANLPKFYPATQVDTTTDPTKTTFKASLDIEDADYSTVTWTGKTLDGKAVVITLDNAINLENISWALVDKDENVPSLTYTATYDPTTRTTEPWDIDFVN